MVRRTLIQLVVIGRQGVVNLDPHMESKPWKDLELLT